jgi:hypothetical protein
VANIPILTAGGGTALVAADTVDGAEQQRTKTTFGSAGVGQDVAEATPLPAGPQLWTGSAFVRAPGDAANGAKVDVTRSVLPTGASTSAKQDAAQTRFDLLATEVKLEAVRALLAGTLVAAPDRSAATFSGSHTTSGTPNTSTQVRPANAARKEVEITNISDITVYLGLLGAAVIEAGIPLYAGSSWHNTRSTEQINSISTGASKKLTVVER